jgi:hypothetical protein
MANIARFHDVLITLKELALKGNVPIPYMGICANLSNIDMYGACYGNSPYYQLIATWSRGWSKHSGNYVYPIKRYPTDFSGLWEGMEGNDRLELLDYLIKKTDPNNRFWKKLINFFLHG